MIVWVLVLVLSANAGGGIERLRMPDEAACRTAGDAIAKSHDITRAFCTTSERGK